MQPTKPPFKPLTSTAERQRVFGKFAYKVNADYTIKITDGWAAQNVIKVHIPQLEGVEGAPRNGVIYFHRLGAEQLKALFQEWDDEGLIDRVLTWGGSFVPRMIRGSKTNLSNHAFGTAFDINAAWNPLGKVPAAVGKKGSILELVEIAHKHGFYWGGHFTRKDGMHFELAKIIDTPVPSAAAAATQVSDIQQHSPEPSPTQPPPAEPPTTQAVESGGAGTQVVLQSEAAAPPPVVKSPFDDLTEIASTGMGTIGKKITTASVSAGTGTLIWTFFQNNWQAVLVGAVLTLFLIGVGVALFAFAYNWQQKKKMKEADIRANPALFNVSFQK